MAEKRKDDEKITFFPVEPSRSRWLATASEHGFFHRKSFLTFWEQHIDRRYLIQTEALEQNPDVRLWPNAT
jgi:hypothetical protein